MGKTKTQKSDARRRLVETAEKLFYAEGINTVGIDRIIAEAGVAKMTLYNHFQSKDDLILAVLQYREEKFDKRFEKWIKRHADEGMDPLKAFFAALKDWFNSRGFRGCMFINSSVELADAQHEGSKFAASHKRRFHAQLQQIISQTAGTKAARVAGPQIALLVEGAIVAALMEQSSKPADLARDAAVTLISKYSQKGK